MTCISVSGAQTTQESNLGLFVSLRLCVLDVPRLQTYQSTWQRYLRLPSRSNCVVHGVSHGFIL